LTSLLLKAAPLYCYNCCHQLSANLAFFPQVDLEFSDFGRKQFIALVITSEAVAVTVHRVHRQTLVPAREINLKTWPQHDLSDQTQN